MSVCTANGLGLRDGDRVLPIVPMFHANAWGQPYAAVMAGADLLLPDRYLQAPRLVELIEQAARACGFDPDRPPRLTKITETF